MHICKVHLSTTGNTHEQAVKHYNNNDCKESNIELVLLVIELMHIATRQSSFDGTSSENVSAI